MRSFHSIVALGLVLFSVGMSTLVSNRVFERLPHLEDEVAYLFQAKTYAGGNLVIETPEPRRAFWQPFVVDYRPTGLRFSKYTPGWPLLLTVGVWLGQPWVINAFLSGLNIALVYRLGRAIFGRDAGLVAATLTAFSPMALLLNGSLMGHTAALLGVTLFLYAYWRLEKQRRSLRWGIIAGAALGFVVATRPLTAIGISFPLMLWSGLRLLRAYYLRCDLFVVLRPLLALSSVTILLALTIPIYSAAATGDPGKNLYTLVWSYDRVGFGECCGRNVHSLEKGLRHVRFDLSLLAADLFGWQLEDLRNLPTYLGDLLETGQLGSSITSELQEHLRTKGDYWPLTGISWLLLPFGLLAGWRKRWTWLLALTALSLIAVHLAYWIGSQRYSTRYYFEALSAFAILSALPIAWIMQRWRLRWLVYGLLLVGMIFTLYAYSTPRIDALYRFNFISPEILTGIEARRSSDDPVLVIVSGNDVRWRALGVLMAVTSPYLDSDIVGAWDNLTEGTRAAIVARFPDREIIEMAAVGNDVWFVDNPPSG